MDFNTKLDIPGLGLRFNTKASTLSLKFNTKLDIEAYPNVEFNTHSGRESHQYLLNSLTYSIDVPLQVWQGLWFGLIDKTVNSKAVP